MMVLQPKDLSRSILGISDNNPMLIAAPSIQHHAEAHDAEEELTTATTQKQMTFSSGGHANFIFLYAAKKLFNCTLNEGVKWEPASLVMKNARSARLGKLQKQHFYEAKLYRQADGSYSCNGRDEGPPVLYFAIAHGMQTMQRALKQIECNSSGLHYLEAMACPHGCVNGGGSARSSSNIAQPSYLPPTFIRETPTEMRNRAQATSRQLIIPMVFVDSCLVSSISESDMPFPRTTYHVVPPMQHTMGAVAGEKVETLQW
jgi:hypothetical protein